MSRDIAPIGSGRYSGASQWLVQDGAPDGASPATDMKQGGELMNVAEALHAIATTGDGCCWYCDRRMPHAGAEAVEDGWDVQRIPGERVASIILVCPACLREKQELGEEAFLQNLSMRVCNTTC